MLFQKRISEAIKNSDKTQKQIAQILNISESNITNWKKGENLPSVDTLYKLCIILDESADYLLGIDENTKKRTNINNSFNGSNINGGIKF